MWLVTHGEGWSVLEPGRGKVLMNGAGWPDEAFLPDAVLVPTTRTVTLSSGALPAAVITLPDGYRMRLLLPAVEGLPAGVLAERAGTLARIDVTGLRWLVRIAARAVIADASCVYLAAWEGTIALDAETGALVWAAPGGDAANVTLGLLGAR